MKLSSILFLSLAILSYTACKKKDAAVPVKPPTDSVKTDTVLPNKVIAYPYTDTFSGGLSIVTTLRGNTVYDTTESNYLFYVRHINRDSIVFISSDSVIQGGILPKRYFYDGYKVSPSNSYGFDNNKYGDVNDLSDYDPAGKIDSFYLSDSVLQVHWEDIYADEVRLSSPTGGVHYTLSNCSYTGSLIKH